MKTRPRLAVILGVLVAAFFIVVMPLVTWFAGVWTDYLWYVDLGQPQVFWTRIISQFAVGIGFGLATFVVLYGNLRLARTFAPKATPVGMPEGTPVQVQEIVQRLRAGLGPVLDRATLWGSLFLSFIIATSMSSQWETFRLALAKVPFGYADPQFGVDVGFFVFRLPAFESALSWMNDTLVLVTMLTLLVHVADGAIQPWARLKGFAPHVKAHLSVLLAIIVSSRAYAYWLDMYRLDFSPRGQVTGASYTDVHAQIPAYTILIVVSIVTAVVLLLNIRYKGWRLPAIALGGWIAVSVLLGAVWPGLMQRFIVAPNEARLEAPY
ncbi:MAG: hypothetical protein FDZ75_04085, partial [Actinobacteria bacterium]